MKHTFLFSLLFLAIYFSAIQKNFAQQKGEPLEGIDITWQNGADRRDSSIFKNMKYFTPSVIMDIHYTHSFNNPNDNTVVGSTSLARNNEVQLSGLHFGGDFNYKNARARFMTQLGTRSIIIPRNDLSAYKGQYKLNDVYRYLSEAYVGYHIDKLYGINIDAGLFMSYIGLSSYYQAENWEYQASFTADVTPYFFNGVRVQANLTKKFKAELLLVNGWQSYGKFNSQPGIGTSFCYIPNSNLKLITNNYYGADAGGLPNRIRFHSDNSVLWKYYNNPTSSNGITKMAFSLTGELGFEKGDGVNGFNNDDKNNPAQYFAGIMFYNRTWFAKNKLAWTIGGGIMTNPGRYLVLYPSGQASPLPNPNDPTTTEGKFPFDTNTGTEFIGWDFSTNLDYMPNSSITFKLELVNRNSNTNYFAGAGGVTSQTGYTTTPLDPTWRPDLVKSETRIIFATIFRL